MPVRDIEAAVCKARGPRSRRNVWRLLIDHEELAPIVLPMLEAWRGIRIRAAELGRQLVADARQSLRHAAYSYPSLASALSPQPRHCLEDPGNFKKSRSVGAWLGLTTRRCQAGEVDYHGQR